MAILHPRTREQEAARYARDTRERQALEKAEREPERLDPELEERKLLDLLAQLSRWSHRQKSQRQKRRPRSSSAWRPWSASSPSAGPHRRPRGATCSSAATAASMP